MKRVVLDRTEQCSGRNSFDTDSSNGEEREGSGVDVQRE